MHKRAFEFYFVKSEYSSQLHDRDIYIIDFTLQWLLQTPIQALMDLTNGPPTLTN